MNYTREQTDYIVRKYIEKPSMEKAQELISDNRFTWNSGIFLFKANTFLSEVEVKCPKIYSLCKNALKGKNFDLDFQRGKFFGELFSDYFL